MCREAHCSSKHALAEHIRIRQLDSASLPHDLVLVNRSYYLGSKFNPSHQEAPYEAPLAWRVVFQHYMTNTSCVWWFVPRYVPNGATGAALLSKPVPQRHFEGIRLESPGPNIPNGPLQHLQICQECYGIEHGRLASGLKSRLPGGLSLGDLARVVSNCAGFYLHRALYS